MLDDSKQSAESYDQTHRASASPFDDMIRIADRERESDIADARESEQDDDPLCWRCEKAESEHYGMQGWCAPYDPEHGRWDRRQFQRDPPEGEAWDTEASDASGWTAEDQAEYAMILDAEHDAHWAAHCVKHGELLREDGGCWICEAELTDERRMDQ